MHRSLHYDANRLGSRRLQEDNSNSSTTTTSTVIVQNQYASVQFIIEGNYPENSSTGYNPENEYLALRALALTLQEAIEKGELGDNLCS